MRPDPVSSPFLPVSSPFLPPVQLVLEDRKNATIARKLHLKAGTVASYLERLYRKLDVRGRVTLVARIYEEYTAILVKYFPSCADCKSRNGSATVVQLHVTVRKKAGSRAAR